MKVGSFGDLSFEVSDDKVNTFFEKENAYSVRYAEHALSSGIPAVEYLGPGASKCTFSIRSEKILNGNICEIRRILKEMIDSGEAEYLTIGTSASAQMINQNPYLLESFTETEGAWSRSGDSVSSVFTLNLLEYRKEV